MQSKIICRNNSSHSPFSKGLYQLFRSRGDTLILAYPYMRKTIFDKRYKKEYGKEDTENMYISENKKEIREKFKNSILEGFKGYNKCTIKLIGTIEKDQYKTDIIDFGFELMKLLQDDRIDIELYITKHKNYYNRIAAKLEKNNMKIMITGSSNISTTSLWKNKSYDYNRDIDIIIWDKYNIEESIVNEIENISTKNSKYIQKIQDYNLIKEDGLYLISRSNFIISPLEPYKIIDELLEEIESYSFIKIHVSDYKIDLLKGIYYFHLDFYKNKKYNSKEDEKRYNCLKKNQREYIDNVNHKNFINILNIVKQDETIKNLLFETTSGNVNFYKLILNILEYTGEDLKVMFKRSSDKCFINYYNKLYSQKI